MNSTRWNLAVSTDTDQALRLFLASNNGGRKGDLSRFVEEAVRSHIFELTAQQIKTANTQIGETEINAMIDEAVTWARESK